MRVIPQTYRQYQIYVESGENFEKDNRIINNKGSVEVDKTDLPKQFLYSALLFSTDKPMSDMIINEIKQIQIEKEFMDSRCYPTGLFNKHNVMILGMAPGRKGRGIGEDALKPSFVYTNTSFYLRKAIEKTMQTIPYITNLLKYATHDNKVNKKQFDTCKGILELELSLLQPLKIIILGNDAYEYFKENFSYKNIVKIMHPAGALYKGMTETDYTFLFKRILKS